MTSGPRCSRRRAAHVIHNGDPLPTDIVGEYTITVHANDGAYNEWTQTGHYWVVPPADYLAVVVPDDAPVGTPFTATVTAYDQFDNVATTYTGTVQITSSDTAEGVILPEYTFTAADQGSHTFTDGVTLVTPGTQTVGATDGELSAIGQTIWIHQTDTTPPVTAIQGLSDDWTEEPWFTLMATDGPDGSQVQLTEYAIEAGERPADPAATTGSRDVYRWPRLIWRRVR